MSNYQQEAWVDAEARFTALYEAHYGHVLAYARRRIDEETARDITAETFAVAWRRGNEDSVLSALSSPTGQLPWLYATARRILANHLRSARHREHLDLAEAAAAAGGVPVVVDPAAGVAERDVVLRALRRLTPRDQEVLQLTTWEDLDTAAGAAVIGCSPTAFKVRLHRARRRLEMALRQEDQLEPRQDDGDGTPGRPNRTADVRGLPVRQSRSTPRTSRSTDPEEQ